MLVSETGHLKLEMKLNKEGPFRRWYVWIEQGKHLALLGKQMLWPIEPRPGTGKLAHPFHCFPIYK